MTINFLCVQMMSLQRLQEHFMGLIGIAISQAVMLKYILQFSEALKEWEKSQIQKILKAKIVHCDETSTRIAKVNWWVHSYSSGDTTLKFLHRLRGIEAMNDIGIIPKYGGILVHDCWSSYLSFKEKDHALCGAHLLRELKFVEDSVGYPWATMMKVLLTETNEKVNKKKRGLLSSKEYKKLQKEYRTVLREGKDEMPPFPEKSGTRGRIKKTDAQNLWSRLEKYEDFVLKFAKVSDVDFTNNRAERDLRVTKVKQKVSGCFRTFEMAEAFFRTSSYIKSMRYRGYSAMEAISLAFQNKIPA